MVVDILTKALAYALFAKFASALTGETFAEKSAVDETAKRKADDKLKSKKMPKKTPKTY